MGEESQEIEIDIHEVRYLGQSRRIGLKWNSNSKVQNDAMERQEETVKFIRETFKMKECIRWVEEKNLHIQSRRNSCFCGENKHHCSIERDQANENVKLKHIQEFIERRSTTGAHAHSILNRQDVADNLEKRFLPRRVSLQVSGTHHVSHNQTPWTESNDIIELPTNSFGEIEFTGYNLWAKPAKFVRISNTSPLNEVLKLMENHWCMNKPNKPSLVISVHGGAKNFQLEQRITQVFSQGLIKAASATNAWIFTTGYNTGVMKLVGNAVKQGQTMDLSKNRVTHNIRCVGIASWGYVQNRHWLTNNDGEGSWPASYIVDPVINFDENQPVPLDSNHTHFLLVDDGYRNRFRTEIAQFRASLEREICRGDGQNDIPVVVVLVEGGIGVLDFAFESLKAGIPLIVCEGTGRIADVFAFAYKHMVTDETGMKTMTAEKKSETLNMLMSVKSTEKIRIQQAKQKLDLIIQCCQFENLMTVFDIRTSQDFDLAILSALFKGCGSCPLDQMRLALKWNRSDVFAELIGLQVNRDTSKIKELLSEALVCNKTDFVKLLFAQGMPAKDYLTVATLRHLYNAADQHSHLRSLISNVSQNNYNSFLCNIGKLLFELLRHVDDMYWLDGLKVHTIDKKPVKSPFEPSNIDESYFENPYKELFLWAILMNRPDMARFFWTKTKNPVMSALVATKLYDGMISKLPDKKSDLCKEYRIKKSHFETLANGIINQAYEIDSEKAMVIIESPHFLWGNFTCLQMAVLAYDKNFMSTKCCQTSVEQTWFRGLKCSAFEIFMGTVFPFFVLNLNFEKNIVGFKERSWSEKFKTFYKAPAAKFSLSLIFYIFFLLLYTFEVLFDMHDNHFSKAETILHFWVLTILVAQIQKLFYIAYLYSAPLSSTRSQISFGFVRDSMRRTLRDANFWTKLDFFAIFLHSIGFALRYVNEDNLTIRYTRLVFCLGLAVFYFRIFRYYMASPYLGPKLFVITKTVGHVFMFASIVVIIMLAYSVAAQALLYPVRPFYWGIVGDIFFYPYWQLYGDISLSKTVKGNIVGCHNDSIMNSDYQYCRQSFWPVTVMLAIYLMFGNILLVNLLIAIFTHVFEEVEKHSTEIWKFEMCNLAVEFDNISLLPPPFNVPEIIIVSILWMCCAKKPKCLISTIPISEKQKEHLRIFEKQCTKDYLKSIET